MTYEQAFKDWSYLWSIGQATDMTGAYVDQDDLEKLLKSPTKKTAKRCLCDQINYWFDTGPDVGVNCNWSEAVEAKEDLLCTDERVRDIAERHGCV